MPHCVYLSLPVVCCPALLYSTLLWCLSVFLALTWHSTSNLFLKRQQKIPNMVEMAVFFLLLWSLLAMAFTSKHLSLENIISRLSLPTLLWTACLGNSRYKCNSFKEMWRNQSMWFPSLSSDLLNYSMVQSPSWAANWFEASQEITCISQNPKVHYRTRKRPPPLSLS